MLLDDEPAHVREEEAAGSIMGVGVRLGVLVMHAVVAGPMVDAALVGNGVEHHQQDAVGQSGVVGTVGPKSVHACSDAQAGDGP